MAFAHSIDCKSEDDWETLEAHSVRVGDAAATRADGVGLGDIARLLGLVHDLGKLKLSFQQRLRGATHPASHSGEGARLLADRGGSFGRMLSGIVAGHHGRLPNPGTLCRRLKEAEALDPPEWLAFAPPRPPRQLFTPGMEKEALSFRAQFLVRFLYGCLTDADDSETAAFYREAKGVAAEIRPKRLTQDHRAAFDRYVAEFSREGDVNVLRADVQAHVRAMAAETPGAFTLTVPTGGGKTLASLGFGLDHAAAHGLDRLIYVLPYMSIVEQTADVFRSVLGEEAVIEHHSSFNWEGIDETEREQCRGAATSWDAPVVVTTAVQFFESLYAARKKRCRKLPSLARSVIVLDEAQTTPRAFLRPCLAAVNELIAGYGASVVLCTATQPALTVEAGFPAPEAITEVRELAPDPARLYLALKRVRVRDIGMQSDAALSHRLRGAEQVLMIVDNRIQARRLFDAVRREEGAAHLSTLMTGQHRRAILADVHARLAGLQPVRLVSTSLIEAGVDLDFPLVLRAAAGIDSLAQAAGRCNREGKLALGEMLVFQSEHQAPPVVEDYAAKGREVLGRHKEDPLSLEAVADYFALLWRSYGIDGLDIAEVGQTVKTTGILAAIHQGRMECPFEDIERAFRLIGDDQRAVIILDGRYGVSADELDQLQHGSPGAAARALQKYSVNVPHKLWRGLWDAGALAWWAEDRFGQQFATLSHAGLYDEAAGLAVDGFDVLASGIV